MFGASACFIGLDSILKHLAVQHDILYLVWLRYALHAAFVAALVPVIGAKRVLVTRNVGLHAARGLLIALSTVFVVFSISYLPMGQTYSIGFSAPLIATALALPLLKERASWQQWLWIVVGFLGVLIAIKPVPLTWSWSLLFPLALAVSNAGYQVLTRLVGGRESSLILLFQIGLWGTLWMSLTLPWSWETVSTTTLLWMFAGGLFGTLAQLLLIQAFRIAPTAIVSPMGYSQIFFAVAAGYFVFGEVPTVSALIGGVIVAASGVLLLRASG
jgi:drug/metabolite transporter (DMT)-like permease